MGKHVLLYFSYIKKISKRKTNNKREKKKKENIEINSGCGVKASNWSIEGDFYDYTRHVCIQWRRKVR